MQVTQECVPDGAGGRPAVGPVDVVDRDRPQYAEGHDQQHPGGRGADAELDRRPPPVGRGRQSARHQQQREHEQDQREHTDLVGDAGQVPADAPEVALDQLHLPVDSTCFASEGRTFSSAAAITVPTSATVSVTVSLSRSKTARWTSRTADRNRS